MNERKLRSKLGVGDKAPLPSLIPFPLKKQIKGTEYRKSVRPFWSLICSTEPLSATDDLLILEIYFEDSCLGLTEESKHL